MTDYFTELFDRLNSTDDRGLLIFLGTPGLAQVGNYVWDTRVPEVTDPWPTLDPLDIDDAIHQILDYASTMILEVVE